MALDVVVYVCLMWHHSLFSWWYGGVCGVVAVVAADDGIAVRGEVNADVRDKRFDVRVFVTHKN